MIHHGRIREIEFSACRLQGVDDKQKIFKLLNQASGFEQFIHKRFVGQKRFSLEGSEALIPAV